jgi:hypothetical protein
MDLFLTASFKRVHSNMYFVIFNTIQVFADDHEEISKLWKKWYKKMYLNRN